MIEIKEELAWPCSLISSKYFAFSFSGSLSFLLLDWFCVCVCVCLYIYYRFVGSFGYVSSFCFWCLVIDRLLRKFGKMVYFILFYMLHCC